MQCFFQYLESGIVWWLGGGILSGGKHEEMGKQICCVNARIKGKVHALIEILGGNSTC